MVCGGIVEGLEILRDELPEYPSIEGVSGLSEGAEAAEVMMRLPSLDDATEAPDLLVTTVASLPSLETDRDGDVGLGGAGESVSSLRTSLAPSEDCSAKAAAIPPSSLTLLILVTETSTGYWTSRAS